MFPRACISWCLRLILLNLIGGVIRLGGSRGQPGSEVLCVDDLLDSKNGSCVAGAVCGGTCNVRAGIKYCHSLGHGARCVLQMVNGTHSVFEGTMSVANGLAIRIEGAGEMDTVVIGEGNIGPWLEVRGAGVQLQMSALTVTLFSGTTGGAVVVTGTHNSTLRHVRFESNRAVGSGGAVAFVNNSALEVTDCSWGNNSAGNLGGGGLFLGNSDISVTSVLFVNNSAITGGGAHFAGNTAVNVTNVTWFGNAAAENAGGTSYAENNQSVFTSCQWIRNTANDGNGGGAQFSHNTATTVRKSEWDHNIARNYAGALFLDDEDDLVVWNQWAFNSASNNGGGCGVNEVDGIRLWNSTWVRNTAVSGGGGLFLSQSENVLAESCAWFSNSASAGGGILLDEHNVDIRFSNCTWTNQTAVSGAAVFADEGNVNMSFVWSTWAQNRASGSGGACYINQDNKGVVLSGCNASDNTAVDDGAVVYLRADNEHVWLKACHMFNNVAGFRGAALTSILATETVRVIDSTFQGNKASFGAALYFGQDDVVLVNSSILSNNFATSDGGAIYSASSSSVAVLNSNISGNTASADGGGMSFSSTEQVVLGGGKVFDNYAATGGGGVQVTDSSVYVYDTVLAANLAGIGGGLSSSDSLLFIGVTPGNHSVGGVIVHSNAAWTGAGLSLVDSSAVLLDAILFNNTASTAGGGLHTTDATLLLWAVSLRENIAFGNGGGLYVGEGTTNIIRRSDLAKNLAGEDGGGAYMQADDGSTSTVSECTVMGNTAATNGGGLFVASHIGNISNVTLEDNVAGNGGGGLFWDFVNADTVLIESSLRFVSNRAGYGPDVASPVHNITSDATDGLTANSGSVMPPVTVFALDYFRQVIHTYDNTAQVSVSPSTSCFVPKLSGSSLEGFHNGTALFDEVTVSCNPGSSVKIHFTVVDTDVGQTFGAEATVWLGSCQLGQIIQSQVCTTCGLGVYSWDANASACHDCLQHSFCFADNGWAIDVQRNYWRQSIFSTRVRACVAEAGCLGGRNTTDDQCAKGNTGPLCSVCEPKFYRPSLGAKCTPCGATSVFIPALFLVGLFAVITVPVVWVYYRKPDFAEAVRRTVSRVSFRVYWKVIFAYMQVVSQFQALIPVQYPELYSSAGAGLQVANLNFGGLFTPHCYNSTYDFYDSLLLQTILPFGLVVVVVVYFLARACLTNIREERQKWREDAIAWVLYISYAAYAGTSTVTIQALPCDSDFDGDQVYLIADYSISCRSALYRGYSVYAIFVILLYPVGILLLYAAILWTLRRKICPDVDLILTDTAQPRTGTSQQMAKLASSAEELASLTQSADHTLVKQQYAQSLEKIHSVMRRLYRDADTSLAAFVLLFEAYRPELWWMEVVDTLRRLCMGAMIVLFGPSATGQLMFAGLVCTFFLLLYSWVRPYMNELANRVMISSLWALLLQLVISLLLAADILPANPGVGVLLLVILVLGPLLPVASAVWIAHSKQNVSRDDEDGVSPGLAMKILTAVIVGVRESEDETIINNNPAHNM